MSSSLTQPINELVDFDTELPELAVSESCDFSNDLAFLDFECTDPTILIDPFELPAAASESMNFDENLQHVQFYSQNLTGDTNVLNQLSELNFLYIKLEQRVSELTTNYGKLQNEYVPA